MFVHFFGIKEMNKHYMNLGQYNNRHVTKHVNLKFKYVEYYLKFCSQKFCWNLLLLPRP